MSTAKKEMQEMMNRSSNQDEILQAPEALHAAFNWCAEVLNPNTLRGAIWAEDQSNHALRSLISLAKAFETGRSFAIGMASPEVMAAAGGGETLRRNLEERSTALETGAAEIAKLSDDVRQWETQEVALRAQEAERSQLIAKIQELKHLEALVNDVDALKLQADTLAARLPTADLSRNLEADITQNAERLVTLTDDILSRLYPEAREMLEMADKRVMELRATQMQIDALRERYENAQALLDERKPVLDLYQKADEAMAAGLRSKRASSGGLTAVRRAEEFLDEASHLLKQADQALADAIKANEAAQLLQPLPY